MTIDLRLGRWQDVLADVEDGSVRLPKVLQNFMGQDRIVPRAKKA